MFCRSSFLKTAVLIRQVPAPETLLLPLLLHLQPQVWKIWSQSLLHQQLHHVLANLGESFKPQGEKKNVKSVTLTLPVTYCKPVCLLTSVFIICFIFYLPREPPLRVKSNSLSEQLAVSSCSAFIVSVLKYFSFVKPF